MKIERVATTDYLVDDCLTSPLQFLERQLEDLLAIGEDRKAGEVFESVGNTVVELKGHLETLLEEEVSFVINLSFNIELHTFLLIKTPCNVLPPLSHTLDPVNLTLRIN